MWYSYQEYIKQGEFYLMQEKSFIRAGKRIFYREWNEFSGEKPKGIIQISHGMVEHTLRYNDIALEMNKAGYIVVADDHRGHGYTDPDSLGYCEGDMFFDTLEDIHELMMITKTTYPDLPYFLFGFSYGSFLTQAFLGKYMSELDGAIIGGGNKQNRLIAFGGKIICDIACLVKGERAKGYLALKLTFGAYSKKFKDKCFLSSNADSNSKYFSDPLCGYVPRYNFYRSFMNGLCKLYTKQYEHGIKKGIEKGIPLLIISGEKDPVGEMSKGPRALEKYFKKLGVKDVTLKLYENSRHEFLNENLEHVQDIISFCDKAIEHKSTK